AGRWQHLADVVPARVLAGGDDGRDVADDGHGQDDARRLARTEDEREHDAVNEVHAGEPGLGNADARGPRNDQQPLEQRQVGKGKYRVTRRFLSPRAPNVNPDSAVDTRNIIDHAFAWCMRKSLLLRCDIFSSGSSSWRSPACQTSTLPKSSSEGEPPRTSSPRNTRTLTPARRTAARNGKVFLPPIACAPTRIMWNSSSAAANASIGSMR